MYAIVKTGGKQYTVKPGDIINVEKLPAEVGEKVQLQALFLNNDGEVVCDADALANVNVTAEVLDQFKGDKVIIFKFKKRKGYKRTKGHRQNLTRLFISEVNGVKAQAPAKKAAPVEEAAPAEVAEEAPKAEEAAQDLSKLTVAQLKELAAEKEIKIPSGARKAEIIELINNAE